MRAGRIYVAPPGLQLLLLGDETQLVQEPSEHRHAPRIDPLFRSAARWHGPRVIGVLLSGMLSDGTAGLSAIKTAGGTTVVQDPTDATCSPRRFVPNGAHVHVQAAPLLPARIRIFPVAGRALFPEVAARQRAFRSRVRRSFRRHCLLRSYWREGLRTRHARQGPTAMAQDAGRSCAQRARLTAALGVVRSARPTNRTSSVSAHAAESVARDCAAGQGHLRSTRRAVPRRQLVIHARMTSFSDRANDAPSPKYCLHRSVRLPHDVRARPRRARFRRQGTLHAASGRSALHFGSSSIWIARGGSGAHWRWPRRDAGSVEYHDSRWTLTCTEAIGSGRRFDAGVCRRT